MNSQTTPDTPTLGEASFAQYLANGTGEVVNVKSKSSPLSSAAASMSSTSLSSTTSTPAFPSPPTSQPPPPPEKDDAPQPRAFSLPPTASPAMPQAARLSTSSLRDAPRSPAPSVLVPPQPPSVWPAAWPTSRPTSGMPAEYEAPILSPVDTRPASSYSKHQHFSSISSVRRAIKYGTGKHSQVELVPQPSDDAADPLNWCPVTKELHYWTLMLLTSLVSVTKTSLVTVNSQLATSFGMSYTAATALTGVPLMVSALSGFSCLVASRIAGKRVVYLVCTILLLIGTAWNTRVNHSYAQFMAARIFQGLGWGAFDVLVMGSIDDTFFEHERYIRHAIYDIGVVATTWGGPLLGGVVATKGGYEHEFIIIASFVAFAVLVFAITVPETTYDRSYYIVNPFGLTASPNSPDTTTNSWSTLEKDLPQRPRAHTWSPGKPQNVRDYLGSTILRPVVFNPEVSEPTRAELLWQVPLAMVAPTTLLLAFVSLLPFSAFWGIASSLSLFFAPLPYDLTPTSIGVLLVAPFVMTTAVVSASAYFWPSWHRRSAPCADAASMSCTVGVLTVGTVLTCVSMMAFAFYVASCAALSVSAAEALHGSAYAIGAAGMTNLKYPVVSLLVGLLAAGSYYLDATVRPMVRRSTQFTSSNVAIAERNTLDMSAAVMLWRTLIIGAFVMALPNAVWLPHMLKVTSIGLAMAQVAVAASVVFVWWRFDEVVRRVDGQVMRCVDLEIVKRTDG